MDVVPKSGAGWPAWTLGAAGQAGQLLAELDHAAQDAQAEAGLTGAQAKLAQLQRGRAAGRGRAARPAGRRRAAGRRPARQQAAAAQRA